MYEKGDHSWSSRPAVLTIPTEQRLLSWVTEHVSSNPDDQIVIVFHGGEPLLAGKRRIRRICESLTAISGANVTLGVQTNGLLLDEEWMQLFADLDVFVALSLDGPPEVHNRNRIDKRGTGTHSRVEAALQLLSKYPRSFSGVLSVIDPTYKASTLLHYFRDRRVLHLGLLLPDVTNVDDADGRRSADNALMAQFLIEAFRSWVDFDDPKFRIKMFWELISRRLGGSPTLDSLGASLSTIITIESDGSIVGLDVMRICDGRSVDLGTIWDTSLDAAVARHDRSQPALCQTCMKCKYLDMCGGGYVPHRYNGLDWESPSYYCDALYRLCEEVDGYVAARDQRLDRHVAPTLTDIS